MNFVPVGCLVFYIAINDFEFEFELGTPTIGQYVVWTGQLSSWSWLDDLSRGDGSPICII